MASHVIHLHASQLMAVIIELLQRNGQTYLEAARDLGVTAPSNAFAPRLSEVHRKFQEQGMQPVDVRAGNYWVQLRDSPGIAWVCLEKVLGQRFKPGETHMPHELALRYRQRQLGLSDLPVFLSEEEREALRAQLIPFPPEGAGLEDEAVLHHYEQHLAQAQAFAGHIALQLAQCRLRLSQRLEELQRKK